MNHMDKKNEAAPAFLYHYTDVDKLALILSNETIRFNSLINMDDKQEQMSRDKQNFGRFVFVSSWTDDEKESIPMWRMYTSKGRGVRIKLPANPFRTYEFTGADLTKMHSLPPSLNFTNGTTPFRSIIPISELFVKDYHFFNYPENRQLIKVEYTDDLSLLKPKLLTIAEYGGSINTSLLGRYKNSYWKFQNEWRYRLEFFPLNMKELSKLSEVEIREKNTKLLEELNSGMVSMPFDYYDLEIDDIAFEKMEVMLAPDISISSKIFVQLLIEKFNPSCSVNPSELTHLIQ